MIQLHRTGWLGLLTAGAAIAHTPTTKEAAEAQPRLVVLIAVDQMIPEQLERLAPWFDGGLARLVREGRQFRAAQLPYSKTLTGPGHISLASGTYPSTHGVPGNGFFDRACNASVYCVEDEEVRPVVAGDPAGSGSARSPRNVRVPALGDFLRAADERSQVVSIAGKDRAAVGLGGQHPQHALWWDRGQGGFMTSSWYAEVLPGWVAAWNAGWLEQVGGFEWRPVAGRSLAGSGTAADEREGESGFLMQGRGFPYTLPPAPDEPDAKALARFASVAFATPLIDRFTLELAAEAVEALDLGADEAPDLLAVGLSACDLVGHSFGPYSAEVTDVVLRLDVGLGRLFALLDERVGPERWIACLSSDHGVLDLPEGLVERGVGAVRVPDGYRVLDATVTRRLEAVHGAAFGAHGTSGGIALDVDAIQAAGLELADVRRLVRDAALEVDWVARAYTWDELAEEGAAASDDAWKVLEARSFVPDRCPDVLVQSKPWYLLESTSGTSHGSPYPYDRRVPLVFWGAGFGAGWSLEPVSSVDAVPTLLARLGIDPGVKLDGKALPRRD